tara:strand:- start:61 stop:405 length:345 start_codon:yes stop_codon:yes gene_type:complete
MSEIRLRRIIRSVIKENRSHEVLADVGDFQDVWNELNWEKHEIDYSDGSWDKVQSLLDRLYDLSPEDYENETEFYHDYETYRNEFEIAAKNWFTSSDKRLEVLDDFVKNYQDTL